MNSHAKAWPGSFLRKNLPPDKRDSFEASIPLARPPLDKNSLSNPSMDVLRIYTKGRKLRNLFMKWNSRHAKACPGCFLHEVSFSVYSPRVSKTLSYHKNCGQLLNARSCGIFELMRASCARRSCVCAVAADSVQTQGKRPTGARVDLLRVSKAHVYVCWTKELAVEFGAVRLQFWGPRSDARSNFNASRTIWCSPPQNRQDAGSDGFWCKMVDDVLGCWCPE